MVKSIFSSNTGISESAFLVNGDAIVSESDKVADLFNNYITNVVKSLRLSSDNNALNNLAEKETLA